MNETQRDRPPEWWTVENTAAWSEEVWGGQEGWSASQRGWGGKITEATGRASAACYRPLTTKELTEMRARDPRPANSCYYDGRPIMAHKPLTVKRGKRATH